jgi:hypothetical protein
MKYVAIPDDVRHAISGAGYDGDRLVVSGLEMSSGQRVQMSFAMSTDHQLRLRVGADEYVLSDLETTRTLLPGTPRDFSITTITGAVSSREQGALVITVDCAREPPALSVAGRFVDAAPRSWALQIDHDIQHQLLAFLNT